jgi:hypothetical protein
LAVGVKIRPLRRLVIVAFVPVKVIVASAVPSPTVKVSPFTRQRQRAVGRVSVTCIVLPMRVDVGDVIRLPLPC